MPTLNKYADRGVRFTNAYANGYSTPVSFPTILTGTYASHYGGDGYMAGERPFLARVLRDNEYETAGFHTNPHLRAKKNYDIGFDTYNDFEDKTGDSSQLRYLITQNINSNSRLYKLLKRIYHLFRTSSGSRDYTPAPTLNKKALTWIDQREHEDQPFFLWTHYMDVHYPFYPPDDFLKKEISRSRAISVNGRMHEDDAKLTDDEVADLQALYRGEVRYMDSHLGKLIEGFRDRDLYEDTIFIVTSDHGELFGEHSLFGHPATGYDKSFHVPLILFGPGIPKGEFNETTTSLVDLPPTIAELSAAETDHNWEGISLAPVFRGDTIDDRDFFLGDEDVLAYQSNGWRLVWWKSESHPRDSEREWELLHVGDDKPINIEEHNNLVSEYQKYLKEFCDRIDHEEVLSEPDVDESTEERLEALGYK